MAVPIFWAAIIFFIYSIPGGDIVYEDLWDFFQFDKLVHIAVFAIWVNMLVVAFIKQTTSRPLKEYARAIALVMALGYGGFLEFIQGNVFIGRTTDPFDFVANSLGALLGILLFKIIYGRCSAY